DVGGDGGLAADVSCVLHASLRRQPVVVPPHGVEHAPAPHALVARQDVGLRVAEDVPDVQGARNGRRRCIYDERLVAGATRVVLVHPEALPRGMPACLGRRRLEVLRKLPGLDGTQAGHGGDWIAEAPPGGKVRRGAAPSDRGSKLPFSPRRPAWYAP